MINFSYMLYIFVYPVKKNTIKIIYNLTNELTDYKVQNNAQIN